MDKLPSHGRVDCNKCYPTGPIEFDKTCYGEAGWRITANPLAWGNQNAEVVVLGFSKGPTQAGALANTHHDEIAYKGGRGNVGKILAHVGVLSIADGDDPGQVVSRAIANQSGRFHFGSMIRCTVERFEEKTSVWKGSGGGMLDRFLATPFGKKVAHNCTGTFLTNLPPQTKLIVMFGLGTGLNYVKSSFELYRATRGGVWSWLNDVAYTDGKVTVVHVEHFASQGALIPQWMGVDGHARGNYGRQAQDAVASVFKTTGRETPTPTQQAEIRTPVVTERRTVKSTKENKMPNKSNQAEVDAEVAAILDLVMKSGYSVVNESKKLAAFCSPSGKLIYVVKGGATQNNIKVMVHPSLNAESLRHLTAVDSVENEYRFHSNMTRFPKRINNGKTETPYGWQVSIGTLGGLESFLEAFNALAC